MHSVNKRTKEKREEAAMQKFPHTHKTDDALFFPTYHWMLGVLSALLAGGFAAWWLVPLAYAERGYSAIGGEWMLVLVISFMAFQADKWFLERHISVR